MKIEELIAAAQEPLADEIGDLHHQLQELRRELADVALPATVMRRVEGLLEQVRTLAEQRTVDAELILRGYIHTVPAETTVTVTGADPLTQELEAAQP